MGGALDNACDSMSQGLILVDSSMRVKYANGAAAAFLQSKREDLVGAEMGRFIQQEHLLEALRAAAEGDVCRPTTVEVESGDGHGVLRFSTRPTRREDVAAAMIVIEDITQQRVAEQARNAFVAHATHELRTPLTNIRLYVETALDEGNEDSKLRAECLNVINQESRRLERMVGDILSVSEIEAGSFQIRRDDVRLDQLFQELEADYRAQAEEKQTQLGFHLPPKVPVVQGDRDKISLALHNLIGNALKYTPSGGKVDVNLEVGESGLVVEVADTGIGIGPEDAEKVFEKFYRASDARVGKITGSGLGLALAREVVRLHGGDITLQSELDKGSTFTMTLPVRAEAA
jgi:PAS domain S-box-containing protein